MRHVFIILLLFLVRLLAFGQVTGKITDEKKQPIEAAVVICQSLTDSLCVFRITTDAKGYYSFRQLSLDRYKITVSFLGYETQQKNIKVENKEKCLLFHFCLKEDVQLMKNIDVVARKMGMRYKGDTLQYNVDYYKDGTERTIGDVLNKLPGIESDATGRVKVQGKPIDKLLLNGQSAFGGNEQLAINNISSAVVDSVEVVNHYSEYSLLNGFQSHEGIALNVKMKKSFLDQFTGKVTGGAGYDLVYQGKTQLLKMGEQSVFSLIGNVNNTGEPVFTFDDYIQMQGGLKSLIHNNSSTIEFSSEEQNLLMPANNTYKRNNQLGALNYAQQFSKRFRMESFFILNGKQEKAEDEIMTQYLGNSPAVLQYKQQLRSLKKQLYAVGRLKLSFQKNENTHLEYVANASWTHLNEDAEAMIKETVKKHQQNTKEEVNVAKAKHQFRWMHRKENQVWLAEASLDYQSNQQGYTLETDSLMLPLLMLSNNVPITLKQDKKNEKWQASLGISYKQQLKKDYQYEIAMSSRWLTQKIHNQILLDQPQIIPSENEIKRKMWQHSLALTGGKSKGLLRYSATLEGGYHRFIEGALSSEKINQWFFNQSYHLQFYFSEHHNLSLGWSQREYLNALDTYLTAPVVNSYQSMMMSHQMQNLYTRKQQATFHYQWNDLFNNSLFLLQGSYIKQKNPVTYHRKVTEATTQNWTVNAPFSEQWYASLAWTKAFMAPLSLVCSMRYNGYSGYVYTNNIENKTQNYALSIDVSLRTRTEGMLNGSLFAKSYFEEYCSSLSGYLGHTWNTEFGAELVTKFSAKWLMKHRVGFECTQSLAQQRYNTNWEASLRYTLNKKIECSLIGKNLLHLQNDEWQVSTFTDYKRSNRLYKRIPGYLLLQVSYTL
jgi:hypothetical protein